MFFFSFVLVVAHTLDFKDFRENTCWCFWAILSSLDDVFRRLESIDDFEDSAKNNFWMGTSDNVWSTRVSSLKKAHVRREILGTIKTQISLPLGCIQEIGCHGGQHRQSDEAIFYSCLLLPHPWPEQNDKTGSGPDPDMLRVHARMPWRG